MNILTKLAEVVITGAVALGLITAPVQPVPYTPEPTFNEEAEPQEQFVGTALPQQDALIDTYLASGITSVATEMTLADGTTRDGATLSGYYCFTIDINSPTLEYVCGTVAGTSVTGMTRGIKASNPNATSSALAFSHRRFAPVQVTDFPFNQRVQRVLNGTDSFDAVLSYSSSVTTSTVALSGQNLASVAYANSLAFGAIPPATETAAGFSELATGQEAASSTSSGSSARLVLPASLSTTTAPSSGNVVPVTQSNGTLDSNFIPNFSGTTTFSGNAPQVGQMYMTAGETINGATLPVPVYQNATNSLVYAMAGTGTTTQNFVGFAVTNGTANGSILVQQEGIVSGFTGLSGGNIYYVANATGTISTEPGTFPFSIGKAINETQLAIQKQKRRAHGSFTATVDTDFTYILGFRPSVIRMHAANSDSNGLTAEGIWTNGVYSYVSEQGTNVGDNTTPTIGTGAFFNLTNTDGADGWSATLSGISTSTIIINANESGSMPDIYVMWEAEE
jgi:hypothetical protein